MSKLHSMCSSEHFRWIFFRNFINNFRFWPKNFRTSDKKFSEVLLGLHSTSPEKIFREICLSDKNLHFYKISSHFEAKNLRLFGKIFRRGCQKCILPVHRSILRFSRKREHVHSILADSGEKKSNYWGKHFFSEFQLRWNNYYLRFTTANVMTVFWIGFGQQCFSYCFKRKILLPQRFILILVQTCAALWHDCAGFSVPVSNVD